MEPKKSVMGFKWMFIVVTTACLRVTCLKTQALNTFLENVNRVGCRETLKSTAILRGSQNNPDYKSSEL